MKFDRIFAGEGIRWKASICVILCYLMSGVAFLSAQQELSGSLRTTLKEISSQPESYPLDQGLQALELWKSMSVSSQQEVETWLYKGGYQLYSYFTQQRAYDQLSEVCHSVIERMEPFRDSNLTEYWTWHGRIAESFGYQGNTQASEIHWLALIDTLMAQPAIDSLFVGEIYLQLTKMAYHHGWAEKGAVYGQQGIDFLQPYDDSDMFARLLLNIGRLNIVDGKYIQAITHIRRSIDILETLPEEELNPAALTVPYVEMARAYGEQGKSELSRQFYRKAVEVMAYPTVRYSDQITILSNLTGLYRGVNDSLALMFLEQALSTHDEALSAGEPVLEVSRLILIVRKGRLLYLQGNWAKSDQLLQATLEEAATNQLLFPALFAANVLVTSHLARNRPLEALKWWQVGYRILQHDFSLNGEGWAHAPSREFFSPTLNNARFLLYRADAFLMLDRQKDGVTEDALDQAEQATLMAQHLLMDVRRNTMERSQPFNDVHQLCQSTRLEILVRKDQTGYSHDIFRLMDRSKAIGLQEDWIFEQRKRHGPIPDSLRDQLENLEREVVELETRIFEDELEAGFDPEAGERAYRNKANLVEVSRDLHQVKEEVNRLFPAFALSDQQYPFVSIEEVRSRLMPVNTAVLSFFYSEYHLFSAFLTHDTLVVHRIPVDETWNQEFAALVGLMRSPPRRASLSQLSSESHHWYEELVGVFEVHFPPGLEELMIVPDGPLVELPFEALVLSPNQGSRPEYLLDRFSVSYWLSVRSRMLLDTDPLEQRQSSHALASFAPQYPTGGDALASIMEQDSLVAQLVRAGEFELPGALEEASLIAKLWNGEVYAGAGVTEEAFMKEAANFTILHLAMHALVEREDARFSRLLFTPSEGGSRGFLNAMEIADMDLPADMVVLSACNTGQGTWRAGEGVFHLGRAFRVAGVRSLILSLWQVPDQATSEIMPGFYQALKAGASKSEALRQAKLSYLQDADPVFTHPYYWAGFVIIGDHAAVDFPVSYRWIWSLLGIIGFLGCLLLGWRYLSGKKKTAANTHPEG